MIISSSNISMNSGSTYTARISSVDTTETTYTGRSGEVITTYSQYESNYVKTSEHTLLSSGETATYSKDILQEQNSGNTSFISTSIYTGQISQTKSVNSLFETRSSMLIRLLEIFLSSRRELAEKLRKELGLDDELAGPDKNYSSWSRKSTHYSTVMETQAISFETTGTAITADGRTLNFHMEVEMSQTFLSQTGYEIDSSGIMMTDPLVVWLNHNPDIIADQKFSFDLDSDGNAETMSMLAQGKGFLAYDRNGDGIINDGSELFGTKSGDGFKDLSFYDDDKNGFIDEADAIYDKLRVWTKDSNGNDILMNLKEADIGAIYLGHLASSMGIRNEDTGELAAEIRSNGVFLHENGTTGIIQQIDFASKKPAH